MTTNLSPQSSGLNLSPPKEHVHASRKAVESTFGPDSHCFHDGYGRIGRLRSNTTISAETLGKTSEKLFDEKVIVNRFEYSDGTLRQRGNWKYDDFQKSIERATSMP